MPTIDDAMALISDIAARLQRVEGRSDQSASPQNPETVSPSAVSPFWDVTYASSLTLTTASNVDWDPLFDDVSATDWKKIHIATAHGEFDQGNLGIAVQRRMEILFDAAAAGTVPCILCGFYTEAGDTDWPIQVKLNGVMTEYATPTPQYIDLAVKSGRNRLVISTEIRPATIQFAGVLWDETRGDKWVDPRTQPNYLRSTT